MASPPAQSSDEDPAVVDRSECESVSKTSVEDSSGVVPAAAPVAAPRKKALTMEDVSNMMREQDAELLETAQFRESCSSGQTPLLQPLQMFPEGAMSLPMLPGPASDADGGVGVSPGRTDGSQLRSDGRGGEDGGQSSSMENGAGVGAIVYRRCLSGEVRLFSTSGEEALPDHSHSHSHNDSPSPISVAQTVQPNLVPDPGPPHAHSTAMTMTITSRERDSTIDRRINEVAQFAEAVGEIPPMDERDVCIIEEGTSDADDDDDDDDDSTAKEIRVDQVKPTTGPEIDFQNIREGDTQIRPPEITRRKSRPQWPFQSEAMFLAKLPDKVAHQDFVYRGICSNPPEITKHGISRGNYAQLHRKAWLEVSDKYHRYGKHLRLYYRYWERLGFPSTNFFDWLDSKGEAAGQPLPNMEECPRSVLDSDTVHYITNPEITDGYALDIIPDQNRRGQVVDVDGDPVKTGPEGWIFVLRDNVIYGAEKVTSISGHSKHRFHHSSFFGGKAVAAAGIIITDDNGILTRFYPHSGHYRPGEAHMQRMLFFIHHKGVDLQTLEMDIQQMLHLSREKETKKNTSEHGDKGEKKRKIDSLHLKSAAFVACYLAHKARFIGDGVFSQIHKIRKADVTSVTEALEAVDNGGWWNHY